MSENPEMPFDDAVGITFLPELRISSRSWRFGHGDDTFWIVAVRRGFGAGAGKEATEDERYGVGVCRFVGFLRLRRRVYGSDRSEASQSQQQW